MGIQSLHHKDWTRSANKAAKSLSSLSPTTLALPPSLPACLCPICFSLSPPLAFISGDKGLFVRAGSGERWCPGWRNVAHHHFFFFFWYVYKKIWCIWIFIFFLKESRLWQEAGKQSAFFIQIRWTRINWAIIPGSPLTFSFLWWD